MATDFGGKVNLAEITVAAAVDTDDTTVTVASAAAVTPTAGWPTRAIIWNRNAHPNPRDDAGAEFVTITDATGDVLTVTRSASPATHAVGDVLVLVDCADDWAAVYTAINALEGNVTQGVKAADSPTFAGLTVTGTVSLGDAATDVVTMTGRLVLRTLASDPLDATPGNRPAGSVAEIAYYTGKLYLCTNAATPTWELVGAQT